MAFPFSILTQAIQVFRKGRERRRERTEELRGIMCRFRAAYEDTRYSRNTGIPTEIRKDRSLVFIERFNDELQGMNANLLSPNLAREFVKLKNLVFQTWRKHQQGHLDMELWQIQHMAIGRQLGLVMRTLGPAPSKIPLL